MHWYMLKKAKRLNHCREGFEKGKELSDVSIHIPIDSMEISKDLSSISVTYDKNKIITSYTEGWDATRKEYLDRI